MFSIVTHGTPNPNGKYNCSFSTAPLNGTSALKPQSLFYRVCAHLLSGAVTDWPHESWDRCQYLQILYHVWPPGGLWAFRGKYEPRRGSVVQQAPPNIRERAEGSSPHRGNIAPWVIPAGQVDHGTKFSQSLLSKEMATSVPTLAAYRPLPGVFIATVAGP